MEKFYLEEVSESRKEDIIDYMMEHVKYNSNINGTGGFDHIIDGESFEECLNRSIKLQDKEYAYSINRCPGKTYLLIRENDNKVVGMINIRHDLTKDMERFGGHIGYGIRPEERRKGYNKINLYLGLIKARDEFNLNRVKVDCNVTNIGSDKTIKALGGVLERCEIDPYDSELTNVYWIDTNESISKYKDEYESYISSIKQK